MPFGWGESHDSYQQVYEQGQPDHEGKFSHELLAGGAAFAGFKAYEDHQRSEGKQVNHAFAKELLAGFVGGEVDKLVETKGLDYVDREKAKRHARENAEHMYDQHYGGQDNYDPGYGSHQRMNQQFGDNY